MGICECVQRKANLAKTEEELRGEMLVKYLNRLDQNLLSAQMKLNEISCSVPDEVSGYQDSGVYNEESVADELLVTDGLSNIKRENESFQNKKTENNLEFLLSPLTASFEYNPVTESDARITVNRDFLENIDDILLDEYQISSDFASSYEYGAPLRGASVFAPKEKESLSNRGSVRMSEKNSV
ncbi:unnamed protein product [Blepharisma stoltei]|uniref:Uncharacterized protein n=1 Tax=Blepharisma stoltei TaxID=1481888 RepID=A0AAU9J2A3_9CILI|nr:unnamed protein product [Blepharisma stoltei]